MPRTFFKYTYIKGATGSKRVKKNSKKKHLTVQGVVSTFSEPTEWTMEKVKHEVDDAYQNALINFGDSVFNVTEIDGEETEEIESNEAAGYYYIQVSVNDTPIKRIHIFKSKPDKEVSIEPKSETGRGRFLNVLSAAVEFARGLFGI